MGWHNPPMSWSELERRLSSRGPSIVPQPEHVEAEPTAPVVAPDGTRVPYAELHAHSHFSFLDGASGPGALMRRAAHLGLDALALTDHDGFYGAPAFAEAAADHPDPRPATVFGAELSLGLSGPQNGVPDPEGGHLLVLARGVEGYHRLAGVMTEAHLRGDEKGRPVYDLDELVDRGRDHWIVLTGCRKGAVRTALREDGPDAAAAQLAQLVDLFGDEGVAVELTDHGFPHDSRDNDMLAALAVEHRVPTVATGNVHYATAADEHLAGAMAAIRARRSLAEMDGWLPASGAAVVRSGAQMSRRFARFPGAVARTVPLAHELAFDLKAATPQLPRRIVPEGKTEEGRLRELVERGIERRWADGVTARQRERIEHELDVIVGKGFCGYFLVVHEIVEYAKGEGILCQGRGSAAASAVCYALGITAIDPVFYELPFERFLSQNRDEEPDIDVDFDSERREEVIQWVYKTYGRRNAAQVANVISYRPRLAIRDAAKALGYSPGQADAWSKQTDRWSRIGQDDDHDMPASVLAMAQRLSSSPRHLGIHSGGMILTERPIGEVCPIERARMEDRTVLQWDKDACEWMGLVKFDLLGLGMLNALAAMMRIVEQHLGERWELGTIPKEEPAVYDMLCRADAIGVFQVESRAQLGTLPRLQPRCFYQLAIEIALIRPGPIQGRSVHPYIRRATDKETVTYPHPDLEKILERTLGVPLFQEQLLRMAIEIGDCTAAEADLLRRAMGSKRGIERIERVKTKLYAGMRRRGITGERADAIYLQILSFADFGFAESHALSFALLVYVSSWFKLHYPAAFLAGLLRAQPMGFYSPQSLTADARRHGVETRRPDIVRSGVDADLEVLDVASGPSGLDACLAAEQPPVSKPFDPTTPDPTPHHRRDAHYAVRLGLAQVNGVGRVAAERIARAREEAPFADMADVARRADLHPAQMEALATAGAFDGWGLSRREALWNAGNLSTRDQLPGSGGYAPAPGLPAMEPREETLADLWATAISPAAHPMAHAREELRWRGVLAVGDVGERFDARRVRVAGLVTHRQRPGTAGGVTFLNIEDETGMLNVICTPGMWKAYRRVARSASGVVIRGLVEHREGVTNLVADRVDALEVLIPAAGRAIPARHASRDFQ